MKKKKVVFDVDDIFWGLNERICARHNINIRNIEAFSISRNDKLTEEQKKIIMSEYQNPEIFRNIKWYKGVKDILRIEQYGAEVHINSNKFNDEILEIQKHQLQEATKIQDDRLHFRIIKDAYDKELLEDVFAFCDDSPYNLKKSNAVHNLTLNKPWNTSKNSQEILIDKQIIRFNTFETMCNYIIELLKMEDTTE